MQLSVIILSYTTTASLFEMTCNCIHSLAASESSVEMEIILIESNKNYTNSGFKYPDFVKVIIPEADFNFHKFLNIGIKNSNGKYVALCNNDLIFYKNWFTEILRISKDNPVIKSFSPNGNIEKHDFLHEFEVGYKVRSHVMGWCIVAYKELLEKIGYLDETFDFGYADNDYALTLKKYNIKHAVVNLSKVEHLEREKVKEAREDQNEAYDKLLQNVNLNQKELNAYMKQKGNSHHLDNKSIADYIKYHKKWGSPKLLYRKNKIADLFIRLNLGFMNRIIL